MNAVSSLLTGRVTFLPSLVAAFLMGLLAPVIIGWDTVVATHYDITMRADGWGSAVYSGSMLAGVAVFVAVVMAFSTRKVDERVKVNATGIFVGLLFLALETYSLSTPRGGTTNVAVVALGGGLALAAITATVLLKPSNL